MSLSQVQHKNILHVFQPGVTFYYALQGAML